VGILGSTSNAAALIAVARATLPPAAVDVWIKLLRPAVRLRQAGAGEQIVGQLGGTPMLPDGIPWPRSQAGRPLGFVAGIDLGRVPVAGLDIPLPADGTLLFFYRDPSEDPVVEPFWISDPLPEIQPPAPAVVFVPAGTATTARAETGATVYPEVRLTAELVATGPGEHHPALIRATAQLPAVDRQLMADAFASERFASRWVTTSVTHCTTSEDTPSRYRDPSNLRWRSSDSATASRPPRSVTKHGGGRRSCRSTPTMPPR
jgi:hypothetical protein